MGATDVCRTRRTIVWAEAPIKRAMVQQPATFRAAVLLGAIAIACAAAELRDVRVDALAQQSLRQSAEPEGLVQARAAMGRGEFDSAYTRAMETVKEIADLPGRLAALDIAARAAVAGRRHLDAARAMGLAIKSIREERGQNDPEQVAWLNELGNLPERFEGGEYQEEQVFGSLRATVRLAIGATSNSGQIGANAGGVDHRAKRNLNLASIEAFDEALRIQAMMGRESRQYAVLLSNSARALMSVGRVEEAVSRLEVADAIYERATPGVMGFAGAEQASYERAGTLLRMGSALLDRRRADDAVRAFTEALRLLRDLAGTSIEQADCLIGLGKAQASNPALREIAVISLEEGVGLYETVGLRGPAYSQALSFLGSVLVALHRDSDAAARLLQAVRVEWDFATQALPIMPEAERSVVQAFIGSSAESLYRLTFSAKDSVADAGFEAALLVKGVLHEAARLEQSTFLAGASDQFRALWHRQAELRSRLASLVLAPSLQPVSLAGTDTSSRDGKIKSLQEELAAVDIQLRNENLDRYKAAKLDPVSLRSITSSLKPGQRLLEYVCYRTDDAAPPKGSLELLGHEFIQGFSAYRYGLFVVDEAGRVQAFDLGPAEPIDRAIAAYRSRLEADIAQFGGLIPSNPQVRRAEKALADLGETLRKLLIDPAAAAIGDAQRLYISPDDKVGLVPFEALPTEAAEGAVKYLAETRRIAYLTTPRELVRAGAARPAPSGRAVLIGNPVFDVGPLTRAAVAAGLPAPADEPPPTAPSAATTTSGGERTADVPDFRELPPTGEFLSFIAPMLQKQGLQVETHTGTDATEERVRTAASPRILQFATHGYFTGSSSEITLTGPAFSGYVRSMLILAGANRRAQTREYVRTGSDLLTVEQAKARGLTAEQIAQGRIEVSNGLLTALEVLGMDLSQTELVGLTACETGLGETQPGEGVIGLRRAFLQAGAASIVMSLWEVPLAETMALHQGFYERWLQKGLGRFEAFAQAKAESLAAARQARNGVAHPFYWAGFIYAGDPGDVPVKP